MLDGELVILGEDGVEAFDAIQNRIHPAESRVNMLAEETPARFRAFDVLAEGRRKLLNAAVRGATGGAGGLDRGPRRSRDRSS